MNFHAGARYQRGRGLGSIFSGLFRGFMPALNMGLEVGKKFLQTDIGKNISGAIAETGRSAIKNITADLLEGKNPATSAQEELTNARKKIASTLRGSGTKRKRKSCQKSVCTANKRQKNKKYNLLDND